MHNLEDSCFSFLQTQLLNSEDGLFRVPEGCCVQRPHEDPEDSAGEEEDEEEETRIRIRPRWLALGTRCSVTPSALRPPPSQWQRREGFVARESDVPKDTKESSAKDALTQYPRYKKYQLACTKNVYNASSHSTSGFASTFSEDHSGTSLKLGLAVGQMLKRARPRGERRREQLRSACPEMSLTPKTERLRKWTGNSRASASAWPPAPLPGPPAWRGPGARPPILLKVSFSITKSVESSGLPGTSQQHFARSSACPLIRGYSG